MQRLPTLSLVVCLGLFPGRLSERALAGGHGAEPCSASAAQDGSDLFSLAQSVVLSTSQDSGQPHHGANASRPDPRAGQEALVSHGLPPSAAFLTEVRAPRKKHPVHVAASAGMMPFAGAVAALGAMPDIRGGENRHRRRAEHHQEAELHQQAEHRPEAETKRLKAALVLDKEEASAEKSWAREEAELRVHEARPHMVPMPASAGMMPLTGAMAALSAFPGADARGERLRRQRKRKARAGPPGWDRTAVGVGVLLLVVLTIFAWGFPFTGMFECGRNVYKRNYQCLRLCHLVS